MCLGSTPSFDFDWSFSQSVAIGSDKLTAIERSTGVVGEDVPWRRLDYSSGQLLPSLLSPLLQGGTKAPGALYYTTTIHRQDITLGISSFHLALLIDHPDPSLQTTMRPHHAMIWLVPLVTPFFLPPTQTHHRSTLLRRFLLPVSITTLLPLMIKSFILLYSYSHHVDSLSIPRFSFVLAARFCRFHLSFLDQSSLDARLIRNLVNSFVSDVSFSFGFRFSLA